jgi:AcrR family transcriptional regulator
MDNKSFLRPLHTLNPENLPDDTNLKRMETRRLIIEAAERVFRQLGFKRSTIADIALELQMSPANVYRFFATRSHVEQAVCKDLLRKIEAEAETIVKSGNTAAQKIRELIGSIHTIYYEQYNSDRKLYDLVEASISKKWSVARQHNERMREILEQIISSGMASGEFPTGDAGRAARLVDIACLRFHDPHLIVEHEEEPEPTLDDMCNFCLAAISYERKVLPFPR